MPEIRSKLSRMAGVAVMLMVVYVGSAWAGGRWKVGDVIVCFGSGTCKVVRPGTSPNTSLLDTLVDGVNNPGDTLGVAINNTLHLLVTDAGTSDNLAKVVEYQIAGQDPLGNPVLHAAATVFNSGGVGNIQAVALDKAGNMFILNANNNSPQIVKLDQSGTQQGNPISLAACSISHVVSMDLSADGSSAYVTSGGTIQNVIVTGNSVGTCSKFADFGSGVSLFGIKNIPQNALIGQNCLGSPCPSDETVLVVASGFTDPDSPENGEVPSPNDPDAVNICTNTMDKTAVSCALLLNTNPSLQTLTPPLWVANNNYSLIDQSNRPVNILDPFLDLQQVFTAGKSGSEEPTFSQVTGQFTNDNAVIWTESDPTWQSSHPYTAANELIIDGHNHIQQVTQTGTSEPVSSPPAFTSNMPSTGKTIDGLVWTDQGGSVWRANATYPLTNTSAPLNAYIVDGFNPPHVQLATFPPGYSSGTTGGPNPPLFSDTQGGGGEVVDGLQWVFHAAGTPDQGGLYPDWQQKTIYPAGAFFQVSSDALVGANDIWQALTPGTSGANEPNFYPNGSASMQPVMDNVVIWVDQNSWLSGRVYQNGELVGDLNHHLQKETEAGTSGPTIPGFTSNFPAQGETSDNAVVWTDLGQILWSQQTYTSFNPAPTVAPLTGTFIVDSNNHLEIVTKAGTTGPFQPGSANSPNNHWGIGGATTVDGLQWQDQGPPTAIVARYPVTGQPPTLQALALNPLIRDCRSTCNSITFPTTSSFWIADSASGNFFKLNFATGVATNYSTPLPTCAGCTGIQGIGIYGAEGAAQPDLAQLPPLTLTAPASGGATHDALFSFNPNPSFANDNSSITITGYNFPSSSNLLLTVYASAINSNSGVSDKLSTPAPPPMPPTIAPAAPCTIMTHDGNCVVWQIDNDPLPGTTDGQPCTSNTCPYLWVAFSVPFGADPNNVIDVLDEQYDDTYSVDGLPKRACQVSLHTVAPTVPGTGNCTYVSPLSSSTSQPPACFTTSRNNIPFKFTCTNLPSGASQANLTPFLRIVQFPLFFGNGFDGTEEPLLFLQGTGGTVNYRFDSTKQQWNFNLNNPMLGFTPKAKQAQYQACTEDSTHTVETFCTNFYVKTSCP